MVKPKKGLPDWSTSMPVLQARYEAALAEQGDSAAGTVQFRAGGEFIQAVGERGKTLMGVSPRGLELDIDPFSMDTYGPTIPWSDVEDVEVTGPESVQRRVTATRAIAFGALALAMQKAEANVVIAITRTNGQVHEYATADAGAPEIRRRISRYRKVAVRGGAAPGVVAEGRPQGGTTVEGIEERLTKLDTLRAKGLVTDDEYREQRARILESI
jgi:hypothetical protein